MLGLLKVVWICPSRTRTGCGADKHFLLFRVIFMTIRKTEEVSAWASRFNVPFFIIICFPVSATAITAGLIQELLLKRNTTQS